MSTSSFKARIAAARVSKSNPTSRLGSSSLGKRALSSAVKTLSTLSPAELKIAKEEAERVRKESITRTHIPVVINYTDENVLFNEIANKLDAYMAKGKTVPETIAYGRTFASNNPRNQGYHIVDKWAGLKGFVQDDTTAEWISEEAKKTADKAKADAIQAGKDKEEAEQIRQETLKTETPTPDNTTQTIIDGTQATIVTREPSTVVDGKTVLGKVIGTSTRQATEEDKKNAAQEAKTASEEGTPLEKKTTEEIAKMLQDQLVNPPDAIKNDERLLKIFNSADQDNKTLMLSAVHAMSTGSAEAQTALLANIKLAGESADVQFKQSIRVLENAMGTYVTEQNQDYLGDMDRINRNISEINAQMGDANIEQQQSLIAERTRLEGQYEKNQNNLASAGLGMSSLNNRASQQEADASGMLVGGINRRRNVATRQLDMKLKEDTQNKEEATRDELRARQAKAFELEQAFGTDKFSSLIKDDSNLKEAFGGIDRIGSLTGTLDLQKQQDLASKLTSLQNF